MNEMRKTLAERDKAIRNEMNATNAKLQMLSSKYQFEGRNE